MLQNGVFFFFVWSKQQSPVWWQPKWRKQTTELASRAPLSASVWHAPTPLRWDERVLMVAHLSAADKRSLRGPEYGCRRRDGGFKSMWKPIRAFSDEMGIGSHDWHVLFLLLNKDKTIKLQPRLSLLCPRLKPLVHVKMWELISSHRHD